MLGIIYLILSMMIGYEVSVILIGPKEISTDINRIWLVFPASFGTGILLITWAVYFISWFASVVGGSEKPLFYGNLITLSAVTFIFAYMIYKRKKRLQSMKPKAMVSDRNRFKKELVLFGILLVFLTYIMFYVFYIRDGVLYAGLTVCSDYAPHTAMMRSFSLGNNFPTQYPHFGGADVKYHFMFQFLAGNLEYLGLRLDFAYNLISIGALMGFLMLLYQLALRITSRMCCGVLTILFFFFRSSMAFWRFLWEHIQAGDLLTTLQENTAFIGYTTNENWGLWNFNVYLNQRHLAFGLLVVTLALYMFMDWLESGISHEEKGLQWLLQRFTTSAGWRCRQPEKALFMGLFMGLAAFWNGAAVIGGLLILMGFAIFSDGKLDYLITALVTIFFSFLQTKIFIYGSAMGFQFYPGFLADKKTFFGVVSYLFWMGGIFFLGLLGLAVFLCRKGRALLISFLIPVIFAFTILMTTDINVNHKYIMISYAFLSILWAWAVCRIWEGKILKKVLAVILAVCLTVTGVYDFVVILKGNGPGRRIAVNMNSELTAWLADNLKKDDLLLTPEYSINEVTMSGVMLYCGWPYYAWSAGYDTYYRAAQAVTIYTTSDSETLRKTVKQEKITYILYEEGSQFEEQTCREDVIAQTYKMVYQNPGGTIRIYKTSE